MPPAPHADVPLPEQEFTPSFVADAPKSREALVKPGETKGDIVFEAVYKTIADNTKEYAGVPELGFAPESRLLRFTRPRFEDATRRVDPLDVPTNPDDTRNDLLTQAQAAADEKYPEDPVKHQTRMRRSARVIDAFMGRAKALIQTGETDSLAAKMFFDSLGGLGTKSSLTAAYNNVIEKTDEARVSEEAQLAYKNKIDGMLAGLKNTQEQPDAPFMHVNSDVSAEINTSRHYIYALKNGQPAEVVSVWLKTLEELGMQEKLYYKVAQGLGVGYDTIVAYSGKDTNADMITALKTFSKKCPPELLSDSVMPTTVPLAKGISRAPDAGELGELLRYTGHDKTSYNLLVCGLTELALRRAAYDAKKAGRTPNTVNPRELADAAKPYFSQFLKIAGIDPIEMRTAA